MQLTFTVVHFNKLLFKIYLLVKYVLNSNLYIYERLQNGKIIANNYDVIRIMFQDLAVDSGYFIQDFILNDSGSIYTEGSIRYANNSIYLQLTCIIYLNYFYWYHFGSS